MVLIWRVDRGRDTTALATTVALWCHRVDARGASAHGDSPPLTSMGPMSRTAVSWPLGPGISPDRPANKKTPWMRLCWGLEFLRGYFLLSFKLNFNNKMADGAGGADGRPFLGFS